MRALLALLIAAFLAAAPAWADDSPAALVRTVGGKRPVGGDVPLAAGDVGALSCIGTCAAWPTYLQQLVVLVPAASAIDVRTSISDAPNGADYVELQSGTIRACPSSTSASSLCPLASFVQAHYGLTYGQMASLFLAASAVRSPLQASVLPTFAQVGAAALDLSNVNPATGRAALGAAANDLSNVTPSVGRTALNLGPFSTLSTLAGIDASASVALATGASTSVTLASLLSTIGGVTPAMFHAACNSNGTTGNGTDDTVALQNAINYAEASGRTLFVPSATTMCRTTAALNVSAGLHMAGDYCQPYTNLSALHPTPGPGSWLFFDHLGPGLFTNGQQVVGASFRDFCTIRPQPAFPSTPSTTWTPIAADYDFSIAGDDSHFEHLIVLNPTNGFFVEGRSTFRDIKGNPYKVGIQAYVDEDILRIQAVHFWPFDTINQSGAYYQHHNLEALQLYRVDNPMISDFFAIGAKRCIHFTSNSYGFTSKAKLVNVDCDLFGDVGLLIDTSNVTAQIENYTSQGVDPDTFLGGETATTSNNGLLVNGSNVHITADNVRTTNVGADAINVTGTGSWLLLHGNTAEKWGMNTGACAVSANSGATINVDPSFYATTGTYGTCLFGGNGTVNSYSLSKVN